MITCGNLLMGVTGIIYCLNGHLEQAAYCIYIAALLDFLDGFVARKLNVSSPIGKDLDSLADCVTFGTLPGLIVFTLVIYPATSAQFIADINSHSALTLLVAGCALLIPVFSALRLAKFNNDTRQSDSFIGVPTPANTLFISSFIFLQANDGSNYIHLLTNNAMSNGSLHYLQLGQVFVILLLCYLLVAELPLIALKFKTFDLQPNFLRYALIVCSVLLLIIFKFAAFAFIIPLYIILSIVAGMLIKKTL
ncbi:MAG: CDP-diacylglycerol--serine O-phosphatidyltransferase [Bacteroidetes bacterium]|nr:CDP-diacylglycerol--serine O-phosphatidyltransferase [Bacteroidota bacterium]